MAVQPNWSDSKQKLLAQAVENAYQWRGISDTSLLPNYVQDSVQMLLRKLTQILAT